MKNNWHIFKEASLTTQVFELKLYAFGRAAGKIGIQTRSQRRAFNRQREIVSVDWRSWLTNARQIKRQGGRGEEIEVNVKKTAKF